MGKRLTLLLGGARSGKSGMAQQMVEASGQTGLFVATATAGDEEMARRITAHQASRSHLWTTLEAPSRVGKAIASAPATDWVLLDCMTLLASNVLLSLPQPVDENAYYARMEEEVNDLLAAYSHHNGEWLIVSNEVGLGLVPPYELGRYYRDGLGRANQQLARAADRVLFLVAGIPMVVKGSLE